MDSLDSDPQRVSRLLRVFAYLADNFKVSKKNPVLHK